MCNIVLVGAEFIYRFGTLKTIGPQDPRGLPESVLRIALNFCKRSVR